MSDYANWCKHGVRAPELCRICFPTTVVGVTRRSRKIWLALCILGISVVLGAEVLPACYVVAKVAVHKHYSKKTLATWKAWRLANPEWKPKSKGETLAALALACTPVNTMSSKVTGFLLPVDAPVWTDMPITMAAAAADTTEALYLPEFTPVLTTSTASPVPEPAPVLLLLTGCSGLLLMVRGES